MRECSKATRWASLKTVLSARQRVRVRSMRTLRLTMCWMEVRPRASLAREEWMSRVGEKKAVKA